MRTWEERATLLREESRSFQHYLTGLPAEAWDQQSACDQWLVKDVVAHLVGNAAFYATTVERGLHGQYDPLTVGPPPARAIPPWERPTRRQAPSATVRDWATKFQAPSW